MATPGLQFLEILGGRLADFSEGANLRPMTLDRPAVPIVGAVVLGWHLQLLGQVRNGFCLDFVAVARKPPLVLEKLQQHCKAQLVVQASVLLHQPPFGRKKSPVAFQLIVRPVTFHLGLLCLPHRG